MRAEPPSLRATSQRSTIKIIDGVPSSQADVVAVEEPLELRVDGDTVAITMRTPGELDDRRLAVGFLFGEGLIQRLDDLAHVAYCGHPGDDGYGNIIDARSGPGVSIEAERVLRSRRFDTISSACGVCGRQSIDDLLEQCTPLPIAGPPLELGAVSQAFADLAAAQSVFAQTGGLHSAAIFGAAGERLGFAEDVGRHNAVDKAVGALLYDRCLDAARLLCVSGRSSFEIVQKAARARIPVVASISAPSSLAIDLAERFGITLMGFVRGTKCNVYAHPERLAQLL